MLFSELDKEDYCLDAGCFAEKNKRHLHNQLSKLKDEKIKFHQIATRYSDLPNVLRSWEFDIIENKAALTSDCEKGIIVDGEGLGKIVDIHLRKSYSSKLDPVEEKAKRKETIRKNRIEKLKKEMTAKAIMETFALSNGTGEGLHPSYGKVLDFLITDRLGDGKSKETIAHFSCRYGWKVAIDRSDYASSRKQVAINVTDTPVERKLALFIELFVQQMASVEYSSQIFSLAMGVGIDTAQIGKLAADIIDGKVSGKGAIMPSIDPTHQAA